MGSNPTRPAYTHPLLLDEPPIRGSTCAANVPNYLLKMERDGYRPETISSHSRILRLMDKNCDLADPESVRQFIASRHVSSGRKENLVDVYSKYSKANGIAFDALRYSREDTLPLIPLQKECESLIEASRSIRQATFLQLLYESACRTGEASRLQFKDLDFEKKTVRIVPEKGSRARELRISEKLCSMLRTVFGKVFGRSITLARNCKTLS